MMQGAYSQSCSLPRVSWAGALVLCLLTGSAFSAVVINEIHYNGEPNPAVNEFVELYNPAAKPVDISGWSFCDGIDFTFGPGSVIPAGGYIVVAERPSSLLSQFAVTAFGPYQGKLSADGERIALVDAAGKLVDEVSYKPSFPWPVGADGTGASMELIDPALDNDLGGSWRASGSAADEVRETVFVPAADPLWHYREGRSEASSPPDLWRQWDFVEDGTWRTGQTPIGYADGDDNTVINMQNLFSTVYLRHVFTVDAGAMPARLLLRVYVDDGAVVWINGVEVARVFVAPGGAPAYNDFGINHEAAWEEVTLADPAGILVEGLNILTIHALNTTLDSSDFSIDAELRTAPAGPSSSAPTPGRVNSTRLANAPPQIRQVHHNPQQPRENETATITARVTDPDGVGSVVLSYQVVAPGAYVPAFLAKSTSALRANPNAPRAPNPAYEDGWVTVPMRDDGTGADAAAGDDVYTAVVPGLPNRTLVRYRLDVTDTRGHAVRVPYADDESLNFAYFVYNGVPAYVARTRSVLGTPHTYPPEVMTSVPVYHLLTTAADFDQAIAYNGSDQIDGGNYDARTAYNWSGTFVYDGQVYDNIGYRLRQRNARYSGHGKRSFKFRFNRGRYPYFRDMDGDYYPTPWEKLSTHRMTGSRSNPTWGVDQAANHLLWNMYGVPASFTHWFELRVIKQPEEAPSGTNGQYLGDFYGLLLALEDYDVRFLDAHKLEKGNLYKLFSYRTDGLSTRQYLAPDAVDDASDFTNIIYNLRPERNDAWLRQYVNYQEWYRYHAIVDAVRHYDVQPNLGEHLKNRFYYFEPSSATPLGWLWVMPWDSDTSWGPNWNAGEDFCKQAIYGYGGQSPRPVFVQEYRNVVRELRDLAWTEEQIALLLDPLAARLAALVPADRDRWTSAPAAAGYENDPPIESVVADMKKFAFRGGNWVGGDDSLQEAVSRDSGLSGQQGRDAYLDALANDPVIPATPALVATGPTTFPVNRLTFEVSSYSGILPFAAWKWRSAEVTLASELPLLPGQDPRFELAAVWESDEIQDGNSRTVAIPPGTVRVGARYRVRVRAQDISGRWSHWSAPIQFIAAEPDTTAALRADLKLTELMFHCPAGSDFDFVELHNAGTTSPLDLSGVTFVAGIDYTFPAGTTLAPGGYLVLVKTADFAAFRAYYGLSPDVLLAGPYGQNFANEGEEVALQTASGGANIVRFTYQDGPGWPPTADGAGYSLIPLVLDDQADGALNDGGNWRASTRVNGSPGGPDL
jgi:hypothetical protein